MKISDGVKFGFGLTVGVTLAGFIIGYLGEALKKEEPEKKTESTEEGES